MIPRGSAHRLSLPWGASPPGLEMVIHFPSSWQVTQVEPPVLRSLSREDIERSIDQPIGSPGLRDVVRCGDKVVIAVDDMTRPLCVAPVLDTLIKKLELQRIGRKDVTILIAGGLHRQMAPEEIERKIGRDLVRSLPVVCRSAGDPAVEVQLDDKRTAAIDGRFIEADRRILIGTVMPHLSAGYSGGAKLVMPGLASAADVEYMHKYLGMLGKTATLSGNRFREYSEAVARTVGTDYTIQLVPTPELEVAAAFSGDVVDAHRAAVDFLERKYSAPFPRDLDVAVLCAYPKDMDLYQTDNAFIAYKVAERLVRDGGTVVLASACTHGLGHHGLFEPGGPLSRPPQPLRLLVSRQLVGFVPGVTEPEFHTRYWEGYPHFGDWSEVLAYVSDRHGDSCRAGIVPMASLQLPTRGH